MLRRFTISLKKNIGFVFVLKWNKIYFKKSKNEGLNFRSSWFYTDFANSPLEANVPSLEDWVFNYGLNDQARIEQNFSNFNLVKYYKISIGSGHDFNHELDRIDFLESIKVVGIMIEDLLNLIWGLLGLQLLLFLKVPSWRLLELEGHEVARVRDSFPPTPRYYPPNRSSLHVH